MTCPSFSDRDQNLREQMMGPPTAQEHLRQSMRRTPQVPLHWISWRESDPRWDLMPVEPVKAPRHTPIWLWMIAVPLSLVALISIARGVF